MKQVTSFIIAFLLCFALPSCRTSKHVTQEQATEATTSASMIQESTSERKSSATFEQAINEEGRQNYTVTINFERWDFGADDDKAAATDTAATPRQRGNRSRDHPPEERHPSAVTKGTVTITGEGAQTRSTQTTAGAQVKEVDNMATQADQATSVKNHAKATEKKSAGGFLELYNFRRSDDGGRLLLFASIL